MAEATDTYMHLVGIVKGLADLFGWLS